VGPWRIRTLEPFIGGQGRGTIWKTGAVKFLNRIGSSGRRGSTKYQNFGNIKTIFVTLKMLYHWWSTKKCYVVSIIIIGNGRELVKRGERSPDLAKRLLRSRRIAAQLSKIGIQLAETILRPKLIMGGATDTNFVSWPHAHILEEAPESRKGGEYDTKCLLHNEAQLKPS